MPWVGTCASGRELRGKGQAHRQTLHWGGELVKPHTGHPSSRVLCVGDKPSGVLGELLRQVERLNPRLQL